MWKKNNPNGFMFALKSKSKKIYEHAVTFLTLPENHIQGIAEYFGDK
jgi:hypothetical protein